MEAILNGEILETADDLIDAFEHLTEEKKRVEDKIRAIKDALYSLCKGEAVTQHVRGERRTCRVIKPKRCWDQRILRDAWDEFPEERNELLRIHALSVQLRPLDVAMRTSGPESWTAFRNAVVDAEVPSDRSPSVKITI